MKQKKVIKVKGKENRIPEVQEAAEVDKEPSRLYLWSSIMIGAVLAVYLGYHYSVYAKLLHENDMWFSNIKVGWLFFD